MNFVLEKKVFLKALQEVYGVVEKKHNIPVLSNMLFKVVGSKLYIAATDLELELISVADLEGTVVDGVITVPARKILDVVKSANEDEKIAFSCADNKVNINYGNSSFVLKTLPANDFPSITPWEANLNIKISGQNLIDLINYTKVSIATNDVRQYLNGLLFDINNSKLSLTSTDGYRMSFIDFDLDLDPQKQSRAILPKKCVAEVLKIANKHDADIDLYFSEHYFKIQVENIMLTCKLIPGQFPECRRFIPAEVKQQISFNKEDLQRVIKRIAILASEQHKAVSMSFSAGRLELSAKNSEQEEAFEAMPVEFTGPQFSVGFNVNYLLDVLNNLRSINILMKFNGTKSGVVIQGDSEEVIYLVMPRLI